MARRMVAPIHSVKHYVQTDNQIVGTGARINVALVDGTIAPAAANTFDVQEGSLVKAIFIEQWVKSNAAATEETKFQFALEKVPTGTAGLTFTQLNNLMAYDNKKNILFYSQGVVGDGTTQSIPVVRQWFKIPKGKQRFGLGDRLIMSVATTGAGINTCGFATYKEYT